MFTDPLLQKLQSLQRAADDPQCGMLASFDLLDQQDQAIQLSLGPLDDKKAFEADRLRLFALNYPHFPDERIEASENPDFVVHMPGRKIGIELRDVIDEAMLAQERVADRAVKLAQTIHEQDGGPPGRASFVFEKNTRMEKKHAPILASKLAKCIPWKLLSATEPMHVSRHHIDGLRWDEQSSIPISKDWPDELNFVTIWGGWWAANKVHQWDACHGGNVNSGEGYIQHGLDAKENKLPKYRESGCDEVWLLLVVPGFHASAYISEPGTEQVFRSSFDRVFSLWLPDTHVIELKCEKSQATSTLKSPV
jgi:hypothetical protein